MEQKDNLPPGPGRAPPRTETGEELGEEEDVQWEAGHPAIQRQECAWCEVRRTTEEPEWVGTGMGTLSLAGGGLVAALPGQLEKALALSPEQGVKIVSNSVQPHGRSLPGFSVHGILQARTLEWVAISFSNA